GSASSPDAGADRDLADQRGDRDLPCLAETSLRSTRRRRDGDREKLALTLQAPAVQPSGMSRPLGWYSTSSTRPSRARWSTNSRSADVASAKTGSRPDAPRSRGNVINLSRSTRPALRSCRATDRLPIVRSGTSLSPLSRLTSVMRSSRQMRVFGHDTVFKVAENTTLVNSVVQCQEASRAC